MKLKTLGIVLFTVYISCALVFKITTLPNPTKSLTPITLTQLPAGRYIITESPAFTPDREIEGWVACTITVTEVGSPSNKIKIFLRKETHAENIFVAGTVLERAPDENLVRIKLK